MPSLEERAVEALRRAGLTVAFAESCTGGLASARLTRVPRASDVLRGGVVCYQDDIKADVLGLDAKRLRDEGAVHAWVARDLAASVRTRLRADLGVGITGFAGPDVPPGGELGLVHVGLAQGHGAASRELHLPGDRAAVREGTVEVALAWLVEVAESARRPKA